MTGEISCAVIEAPGWSQMLLEETIIEFMRLTRGGIRIESVEKTPTGPSRTRPGRSVMFPAATMLSGGPKSDLRS